MKKLHLVYALQTNDPEYLHDFYASRRIEEEAMQLDVDFGMELASSFDQRLQNGMIPPADHRGLLVRGDYPLDSMSRLERQGFTVINPVKAHELCIDKLATAFWLQAKGWPHPRTAKFSAESMQLPAVLKPRFGKMGRGIYLIENSRDLSSPSVREAVQHREYLSQELISTSYGRDIRFFFADFEESCAIRFQSHCSALCVRRQGPGFLSNAHAGGTMERYKPDSALSELAYVIFRASGLVYGTVDFLFADEAGIKFTVCELNSMPGFEELEHATQANAARAIVLSCLRFLDGTSSFSPKNML